MALAFGASAPLAAPAVADPASPPSLSIGIDDGRAKARGGEELTYTVKVANTGAAGIEGLRLTQSLPPGLRFTSADHDGRQADQVVTWTVTVPAGKDVTVTSRGVVEQVPRGTTRLASSACAYTAGQDRPAVCSTDSDALDATALATASPEGSTWWYWAAGVLAAVAVVVAVLLFRRRRKEAATAGARVPAGRAVEHEETV
ncbi:DUF11 domain-containing protein [Amycolatopsis sp. NPDC059021]|uniref:DUF11 domain-containing protein n=1 Tax=Amycolatopsis sp. NPDC059021 TaxID=3346704 RepID=UPI00366A69FC